MSKPRDNGYIPAGRDENVSPYGAQPTSRPAPIDPAVFYGNSKPKGDKIVIGEKSAANRRKWGGAKFDPEAEGAVVMQRPPEKWATAR
jgi:hypothetical protein